MKHGYSSRPPYILFRRPCSQLYNSLYHQSIAKYAPLSTSFSSSTSSSSTTGVVFCCHFNMADLTDERGNPVLLTDEQGNPVKLTDEHGNPIHITGVAKPEPAFGTHDEKQKPVPDTELLASTDDTGPHRGPTTGTLGDELKHDEAAERGVGGGEREEIKESVKEEIDEKKKVEGAEHSGEIEASSSSSGSSEDNGQGGRRKKKKGLKQKIKEKLTGSGKHKEEHGQTTTTSTTTDQGSQEHEKKSIMEKIKETLPGHHHSNH